MSSESGPLTGLRVMVLGSARPVDITALLLLDLGAHVRVADHVAPTTELQRYLQGIFCDTLAFGEIDPSAVDIVVHHYSHCDGNCSLDMLERSYSRCDIDAYEGGIVGAETPTGGRAVDAISGLMRAAHAFEGPRPVFNPMELTAGGTALIAAAGAQLAHLQSRRTGSPSHMRVSEMKGALLFMAMSAIFREAGGDIARERVEDPQRAAAPTNRCFSTADGAVLFAAVSTVAWAKAATAMDRLDLLVDPRFEDVPWGISPEADHDLIREIERTLRTRSTQEWVQIFRTAGIPVSPVLGVSDFRNTEHLHACGTLTGEGSQPRVSLLKTDQSPTVAPAAASLTADLPPAQCAPLAGIKVVEVATFAAAPCAAASLADFGATVAKLEMPPAGDPYREQGLAFSYANRNKSFQQLNLSGGDDHEAFVEQVRNADVFILNNRLSSTRKLGLDFDSIRRINPRIVYCWVTAWGSGGPLENEAGVDPMFQAVSGMAEISGGSPGYLRLVPSGGLDMYASMLAVNGILAGLIRRDITGQAQRVEASLAGAAVLSVLQPLLGIDEYPRVTERDPVGFGALDRVYATGDHWLYLHVTGEQGWFELATLLGRSDWLNTHTYPFREQSQSGLADELAALFLTQPRSFWLDRLRCGSSKGITAVPVNSTQDLYECADPAECTLFDRHTDEKWGPLWYLSPFVAPVTPSLSAPTPIGRP